MNLAVCVQILSLLLYCSKTDSEGSIRKFIEIVVSIQKFRADVSEAISSIMNYSPDIIPKVIL